MHPFRLSVSGVVIAMVSTLALGACGGADSEVEDPEPTTPATTLPDGTTTPGTELSVGDTATVRLSGTKKRSSRVKLTVTALKKGKISALDDFKLDAKTKKSTPYYVRARLRNVGDGDLSGQALTLYGLVSKNLLVPPVEFGSSFGPCPGGVLPATFTRSKQASVCLVMLAPKRGTITSVEFRSADNADPISWSKS